MSGACGARRLPFVPAQAGTPAQDAALSRKLQVVLFFSPAAGGALKKLSPADKFKRRDDPALARLLDLNGEVMEVGGGFWIALRVRRAAVSEAKPHGIAYSLVLIGPKDERLVCYDNAHPVKAGRGPGGRKPVAADHRHVRSRIAPYAYTDAEALMRDFWTDVERVLKEEGVP